MMPNFTHFPAKLFAATGLAFSMLLGSAVSAQTQDVRFSLEWLYGGGHAGFYVAQDRGFYKERGLSVSIERGYGSADTIKRVATGSADLGIADVATVLAAAKTSANILIVSTFYNGNPNAILTLRSSGIQKLSELSGHTVGGGSQSASLKLFPAIERAVGLTNVKIVPMDSGQIYPALLTKNVDAITGFIGDAAPMEPKARKQNDDIVIFPYSDYGIGDYGSVIITTHEYAAAHGDVIRAFLAASMRGIAQAMQDPQAAVEIEHKYVPTLDVAPAVRELELNGKLFDTEETRAHGLGTIQADHMAQTYEGAKKFLGLSGDIDLNSVYTTKFLPDPPVKLKQAAQQ